MDVISIFVLVCHYSILYLILFCSVVAERPQQMLMRVAVGIHKEDIDAAIEVNIF